MAETFTKYYLINVNKLKISIDEFIEKLEKQNDQFDFYSITHTVEYNKNKPFSIKVKLVSPYYLGATWNLFKLFNEYVEIKTDVSELEV